MAIGLVGSSARADIDSIDSDHFVVTTGRRDAGPGDVPAADGPYWAGVPTDVTWRMADYTFNGTDLEVNFSAPSVVALGCYLPGAIPLVQVVPFFLWGHLDTVDGGPPVASWLAAKMAPDGTPSSQDCQTAVGLVTDVPFVVPRAGRWQLASLFLVDNRLAGIAIDPDLDGGTWAVRQSFCPSALPYVDPCEFDAGEFDLSAGPHRLEFAMTNDSTGGNSQNPTGIAASFSFALLQAFDAGVDAGPPDAGPPDAGTPDAGTPDAGTPDAGAPDAGTPDAGTPDAGTPDAGTEDAGTPDAGTSDAGAPDAGAPDAGAPDAGAPDAGAPDAGTDDAATPDSGFVDAGPVDSGTVDAGGPNDPYTGEARSYGAGCACSHSTSASWLWFALGLALVRKRTKRFD